ncbi:MAG: hypothetical protein RIS75_42 [Actinomycetota bacterium]
MNFGALNLLRFIRGLALYMFLGLVLGVVWARIAPRAECYLYESKCVAMVDEITNAYFFADLIFGVLAAIVGSGLGIRFGRRWWEAGFLFQALMAITATAASYVAMLAGEWLNPLTQLTTDRGIDALTIRGTAVLFVWALCQQLVVVYIGNKSVSQYINQL